MQINQESKILIVEGYPHPTIAKLQRAKNECMTFNSDIQGNLKNQSRWITKLQLTDTLLVL